MNNEQGGYGSGAVYCYNGTYDFSYCTFSGGFGYMAGAIYLVAHATVDHCTFNDLPSFEAADIYVEMGSASVSNCIHSNIYNIPYALYCVGEVTYSDFYGNCNSISGGPAGFGELTQVNANGDSCDVYGNIFEDPLFEDRASGNFQITWANFPVWDETRSPCIDAGDSLFAPDPDSTVTDMGRYYFDQTPTSLVTVTLTPYGAPIQLPASGGSFDFNIAVANNGTDPETFDIWTMATLPNGSEYGPIINVPDFTAPANWSANRDRTQMVPGGAPAGMYTYNAYIGEYPDFVWDTDSFPFTKEGVVGIVGEGWACWGEPFEAEEESSTLLPSSFILHGAYPNPFNPVTAIGYQLSVPSLARLQVFDVQGRLVAELVNGWRDAGYYEVTFDASDLVSGLYIYHLSAGAFTASGKMVLMK